MKKQEDVPGSKSALESRKKIGARITCLREAHGLSQKALSDELAKLGLVVRRETITQWENGTRDLKTEYLARLSEFFGVSSDWLLGLTGAPERTPAAADELGLSYKAVDALRSLSQEEIACIDRMICSRSYFLADRISAVIAEWNTKKRVRVRKKR